ncbi:MAG: HEAT repeat domain-containing protein [Minicystis sp.]
MPKETLKTLDRDAERLLFAGAQVARTDGSLDPAKAKLAPLAPKAPALATVVAQVEKLQKATSKTAAAELLNLAALMAQVRGAQAAPAPAPAGDLAPLPRTEPIGSPLSSTELSALVGALSNAADARHRPATITDAADRDAVRDLRILPFAVAALGDSGVGWVVQSQLLPKLGSVVVPELRASLKLKGSSLDARKLRVLAEIEREGAKPLLIEAAENGSPEIRAAAIDELSELDPAAAEPIALRLLATDRSADVKRAAVEALSGAKSDAALDALFEVFTKGGDLRRAAGESLAAIDHPRATARAEALLTADLLALGPFKAAKADTKAAKAANEKAERAHAEKVGLFESILDLLASRKDKDTTPMVLRVFREHKIKDVRESAARALLKSGYAGAFDELAPSVLKAGWDVKSDFIEGILKRDPARAFERLGPFLKRDNLKSKDHVALAEMILNQVSEHTAAQDEPEDEAAEEAAEDAAPQKPSLFQTDPRWVDAAIALLDHPDLAGEALDVLDAVKSDKALAAVLKLAAQRSKHINAWRMLHVLVGYKDARIAPLLVGFLDQLKGYWGRRTVYRSMRTYDDPALVPGLEAWLKAKKRLDEREKNETRDLLDFLKRDRALTQGV